MEQAVPPAAVHAEGIVKRFGATVALDRVGITVAAGDSHALVGRNGAGKSTLVSVLTGLQTPDAGRVSFLGEPAPAPGDTAAWQSKVACVYQKSMVVPDLTVAENLFLNRFERGRIRWSALRARASDLLAEYGVDVDPNARAGDLTVEQGQFVEIARALSFGARFIILDEPTAQLDAAGIDRLFTKLRDLQRQGVAFLFISHHLQEVYDLCTTVTVYRDARHVVTAPVAELGKDALVEAMTGEAAQGEAAWHAKGAAPQDTEAVLRAEGLALDGAFDTIDFAVESGEVLGLAGATASGNTALGETLVGLRRPTGGRTVVAGKPVRPGSVPHALGAGIGYVPEDRHRQGLVLGRSVAENATLSVTDQLGPYGTVLPSRTRAFAERMISSLDIKTSGPAQPVADLSGGNQQKVVIARALAREPRVLVAIRPTAGVDVKSKDALLGVVRGVADRGDAAVIVSDELDDLRVCDRVIALFHGRVIAEFGSGWSDRDLVSAMEGLPAGGDEGAEE
ncbi:simple sugar transport system ATP-binding protein [Streptomyces sp. DvalAA-14]|uniref:sugar ABC transporter ATP-binding protein n=1 Tax=unclassified Streptomyces TaxID=2593676 RepID=UPI00081B84DB|nr:MULTISPECIES: sugar ABC transporter ATP-binding protein [unclassified Streptomyces]MYS20422.1 ATP-binding cassette domain-containing protein [Streptomyces sp. SID4948]SCD68599.1 simple sugar transport system ATP-binding protein [Streptomyces sp. DvalAA-14]